MGIDPRTIVAMVLRALGPEPVQGETWQEQTAAALRVCDRLRAAVMARAQES